MIEFARAGITLSDTWKILVEFESDGTMAPRADAGSAETDRLTAAARDLAAAAARIPEGLATPRMRRLEIWCRRLSGGEPLSAIAAAASEGKVFLQSEGNSCAVDAAVLLCGEAAVKFHRLFKVVSIAGKFAVPVREGRKAPFGWDHQSPILDSYEAAFGRWASARGLSAQERLDALSG